MNRPAPLEMQCAPLPRFDLEDWPTIHRLFEPLPAWKFQQAWLPMPQPELRPGVFKAGAWSDALVVHAELPDRDIFNPITEFNEVAYTKGDTFEMFLRPEGQKAYFEFHVTPGNQKLQLRFGSAEAFGALPRHTGDQVLVPCKVHQPLFDSRTQVLVEQQKWHVVAAIPFASVVEGREGAGRDRWRFSASRYDYTRGRPNPVLSSTSPHSVCSFHRQEDWGTLLLSSPMLLARSATPMSGPVARSVSRPLSP